MPVFTFDVTMSSHDLLRRGITEVRLFGGDAHHHRIVIQAETVAEAYLLASQMASCHGMCTGCYLRI